jgi:hypothetical protein
MRWFESIMVTKMTVEPAKQKQNHAFGERAREERKWGESCGITSFQWKLRKDKTRDSENRDWLLGYRERATAARQLQ